MNLVLSGPIDATLRNLVVSLSKPRRVVALHDQADRLEGVDDASEVKRQVGVLCDAARVDHAYVEEGVRFSDFKLLAMDMDSTLITIECIDEIADFAGKKKEVAAITEAAMRGELDFEESLRQRVASLAGTPAQCLDFIYAERLSLNEGAAQLVDTAKQHEVYTVLLSGGFTYFAQRLANELCFDEAHANTLEISDGQLTGRLIDPVIDGSAKARIVVNAQHRRDAKLSLTVGDGANDIAMMSVASHSVAYHAHPLVQHAATAKVNFGTLRTILDYYN